MRYTYIIISAFFFATWVSKAQAIYVSYNHPFFISNSKNPEKKHLAVWISLPADTAVVAFKTHHGKTLHRTFYRKIANPYYIIEHNRLRYRPNQQIKKADTVAALPIFATTAKSTRTQAPIITTVRTKNDKIDWEKKIKSVQSLDYEWEKTERIIAICSDKFPSCPDFVALLQCLKYHPSRVTVLNALGQKVVADCREASLKTLPKQYRKHVTF